MADQQTPNCYTVWKDLDDAFLRAAEERLAVRLADQQQPRPPHKPSPRSSPHPNPHPGSTRFVPAPPAPKGK
jgi:hypothetical protein